VASASYVLGGEDLVFFDVEAVAIPLTKRLGLFGCEPRDSNFDSVLHDEGSHHANEDALRTKGLHVVPDAVRNRVQKRLTPLHRFPPGTPSRHAAEFIGVSPSVLCPERHDPGLALVALVDAAERFRPGIRVVQHDASRLRFRETLAAHHVSTVTSGSSFEAPATSVSRPDNAAMADELIRVGDTERDAAASMLRDHCAAGRLTLEELDARLEGVYGAVTRQDLIAVLADLPNVEAPRPKSMRRRVFWPGVTPFGERRALRTSVEVSYAQAMREMVPRMGMAGYQLVGDVPPRRLVFRGDAGRHVTVMFHALLDGGTEVSAFGEAERGVRKAFAQLSG
jgi:hypothetical protein